MATQPRDKDTPRRTKDHQIADLSVNHVKSAKRTSTSHELSYGHLAKVLAKLGYRSEEQQGSHVLFRYRGKPSVLLPWCAANNKVDETRLAGVFQLVSGSGVASRRELEQLLFEPLIESNGRKASPRRATKRASLVK